MFYLNFYWDICCLLEFFYTKISNADHQTVYIKFRNQKKMSRIKHNMFSSLLGCQFCRSQSDDQPSVQRQKVVTQSLTFKSGSFYCPLTDLFWKRTNEAVPLTNITHAAKLCCFLLHFFYLFFNSTIMLVIAVSTFNHMFTDHFMHINQHSNTEQVYY